MMFWPWFLPRPELFFESLSGSRAIHHPNGSVKTFRQSYGVRRLKPHAPRASVRCLRSEKTQHPRTTSRVNSTDALKSSGPSMRRLSSLWKWFDRRIEEFRAIIRGIVQEEGTDYIPLHEAMLAQIMKSSGRAFTEFAFLPFYRDAFRTLVLRKSPDEVARINGWSFHTDGVHLNSRSGLIVADLVQKFIER